MLRLRSTAEVPSGYWRFPRWPDRPLTNSAKDYIIGGDFPDLIFKITEWRIINSLPLGDIEAEAMDWLCRNSSAPCAPAKPKDMQAGHKASGGDVARFLMAMAAWVKSAEIVPQEEAERRAEACAGCRFNTMVDDGACLGCFGLMARIMRIIGTRRTRMDDALKFCGKCGCSLPVVAFTPMHVLNRAHPNADFKGVETGQFEQDGKPVMCWRGQ